jgi:alcohol/geraniol dehydrogenase (NADP+)
MGCHVTAFTSSPSKADEAKKMGAHAVLNTRSGEELNKAGASFDFILSTVAAPDFDFNPYVSALAPNGRLHIVGAIPELRVGIFPLLLGQRSVSGSPTGPPATVNAMFDFCARHNIEPITEEFPMSKANEALKHLEAGKARYRIVLKNDFQ